MSNKFVISAVSASGKTTLVNSLLLTYPEIYRIKTCTTRAVRPEEIGDEYYFLSEDEVNEKINNDEFIEHSIVYGNHYGLTKHEIDTHSHINSVVILDVQGATKFKKVYEDAITIFIAPPPMDVLEKRLRARNTSDIDVINRLSETKDELEYMPKYDHIIPYGSLNQMTRKFFRVIEFYTNSAK